MNTAESIIAGRLIAVLRLHDAGHALECAHAVADGGITTIEVTSTVPEFETVIRRLSMRTDLMVGAGTILDQRSAVQAVDAGAHFCASPVTDPRLVEDILRRGVMAMPGALTPTEIAYAHSLGAAIVKVFPMPSHGVSYIKAIRGPLPHIPLAPSGGVTLDTGAPLLHAGSAALNVGSWLTHAKDGELLSIEEVTHRARLLVTAIRE